MTNNSKVKQIKELKSDKLFLSVDDSRVIGQGLLGVVLRGFHLAHGQVAIKTPKLTWGLLETNMLLREAELQQFAKHENVVEVYGLVQSPHIFGTVMEYSPVGDLRNLLDDSNVTLDALLRLRIIYDISNGLSFIHEKEIVHGDIKPENIILTKNLRAKITDFGSAKMLNSLEESFNADPFQLLLNSPYTPRYAPPEYHNNPMAPKEPSYDTYSFAVTMLKVLGREIPMEFDQLLGRSRDSANGQQDDFCGINILIHNHIVKRASYDPSVVDVMTDVMKECWKENPAHRPLMSDVKKSLQDLLEKQDSLLMEDHVGVATRDLSTS